MAKLPEKSFSAPTGDCTRDTIAGEPGILQQDATANCVSRAPSSRCFPARSAAGIGRTRHEGPRAAAGSGRLPSPRDCPAQAPSTFPHAATQTDHQSWATRLWHHGNTSYYSQNRKRKRLQLEECDITHRNGSMAICTSIRSVPIPSSRQQLRSSMVITVVGESVPSRLSPLLHDPVSS